MASQIVKHLLQRLNSPDHLYANLMKLDPQPMDTSTLRSKLNIIDETIGDTSGDTEELKEEWREKIAILWAKYADFYPASAVKPQEICPASPTKTLKSMNIEARSPLLSPSIQARPSSGLSYFPQSNAVSLKSCPLSKEEIKSKFNIAFFKLNVVRNISEIEGMKAILNIVVKVEILIGPYALDYNFAWEIVTFALIKLPTDMREQFVQQFQNRCSRPMSDLRRFVQGHILDYCGKQNITNDARIMAANSLGTKLYCSYCHLVGHPINKCPEKMAFLCGNCLQFGHTLRLCKGVRKIVGFEDLE